MRPATNMRLWLLIPIGLLVGFSITPAPAPRAAPTPAVKPPSPKTVPPPSPPEKPAIGISKPLSLNDIDSSKRLITLLKIQNASPTKATPTLNAEQERLRLLGEIDATDTARILGDLWNLKADPAGPRSLRDLGLPSDTLGSTATASLERLLIERLIDLDRHSAWNLAVLRSQTRALALTLKHLRKLLPTNEILERIVSLKPEIARETHRIYLHEPDAEGTTVPPLIPAESLAHALAPETLRWFQQGPLILLEELIESSLQSTAETEPQQAAVLLADALETIRKRGLDAEAWDSIAHDLLRRLHRATEKAKSLETKRFFETLASHGLQPLVDAYQGPSENQTQPESDGPSLRASGAGAFRALTLPSSPLADDPSALHSWFLCLPEGPYREGFLDAALEQAIHQTQNRVATPDLLSLGTPEERVAFFIDWFERHLKTHQQPLTSRAILSDLQLPADELASVLNHIAPLRNP